MSLGPRGAPILMCSWHILAWVVDGERSEILGGHGDCVPNKSERNNTFTSCLAWFCRSPCLSERERGIIMPTRGDEISLLRYQRKQDKFFSPPPPFSSFSHYWLDGRES